MIVLDVMPSETDRAYVPALRKAMKLPLWLAWRTSSDFKFYPACRRSSVAEVVELAYEGFAQGLTGNKPLAVISHICSERQLKIVAVNHP